VEENLEWKIVKTDRVLDLKGSLAFIEIRFLYERGEFQNEIGSENSI